MATRRAGNQSAFLAAFSICAQIKMAARAARIDRASHYYWKANDPCARYLLASFERRLDLALE